MTRLAVVASILSVIFTGCGGGGALPNGSVVNYPGGGGGKPTQLVNVKVSVTIPPAAKKGIRPDYVSVNTKSLVIELASVDGQGVTGVNPTTMNTAAKSRGCKTQSEGTVCTAIASGSPGKDVFSVTTYDGANATGTVLSVGTVQAKISANGSGVQITNRLSLTLDGVIASLGLVLAPNHGKRGKSARSGVRLTAYDASGAQIVGPSDFASPVALSIQGDVNDAFLLHLGDRSGTSLTIAKPASGITLTYDGNPQAQSVTVQAAIDGPSAGSAKAQFKLSGKGPPPPVGTIYALNLGSEDGLGATVTEYDGSSKGNAAPIRTLQLDSKLYARTIAVDANDNLYVGYFDSALGFNTQTGKPDDGNEIAVYDPHASGSQQPTAVLTEDKGTKTTLFPRMIAFDSSNDLVTYGATAVDGNGGNDAVLIYAPGSKSAASPANAWAFSAPQIRYAGPTGLALDSAGNFYVNGELHSNPNNQYGLFVAPAADYDNPNITPSRTIPWNDASELAPNFTRNVVLDGSNEILIANVLEEFNKSSYPECQGRVNVFAAGSTGGSQPSESPLRVLTLATVFTPNAACVSYTGNPLAPFFPSIAISGSTIFVADDFNNAVDAFPSTGNGTIKPSLTISGSATGLNAPIAVVVTTDSGRAQARPAYHR